MWRSLVAASSRQGRALSTLRVAGVPEHFNEPFHLAKERGLYEKKGVAFEWTSVPQGTGAMAQALEAGEVDVAVMLTEGAVARVASGAPIKLVGTYVKSPLRWGVHVKKGSSLKSLDDLKGKVFGVSRMLSGSHLMAHFFAHQKGWDLAKDAPLKLCGTLQGAREAMAKSEIDAWMWERFTTKHLVDSGEWDIVGEVPTPWPCFIIAVSDAALKAKGKEIADVVEVTQGVCKEFKANGNNATLSHVSKHHAMSEADAAAWLSGTEWACALEASKSGLKTVQEALVTIGQLKEVQAPERLVAHPCRLVE